MITGRSHEEDGSWKGWEWMMDTKIVKMEKEDQEIIKEAAKIWRAGGLVAFPTETVYGIGANGLDAEAASRIYAAKGRPSDNPLILHIAEMDQVEALAVHINESGRKLMKRFWPGPLTLIYPKAESIPYETTGGLNTVAIRMPNHPIARALLCGVEFPIAAPSANLSGRPSPTTAEHVIEDMNGRIEMIVDGGAVGIGVESTIVDLTEEIPVILRPGYITKEMLEETVGRVATDPAVLGQADRELHPKAPGMKYRHYAPKASLTIVEGEMDAVIDRINIHIAEAKRDRKKIGVIATSETEDRYEGGVVKCVGSRRDMESIAYHLYETLRSFDTEGVDAIYSESFPDDQFGQAVMNRLRKAAGHQVIKI